MSGRTLSAEGPEAGKSGGAGLLTELRGGGGGGEPTPLDLGAGAKPPRRVNAQMLVLALVLVASAASLYTMRKQGMGAGMTFQPVKLEYEPENAKPEVVRAQQRVMQELARSAAPAELHDAPLRKNPFVLPRAAAETAPGHPAVTPLADPEKPIRDRLAQLSLGGIMQGPVPLARINGKTVRVSDTFEDFMVVEIGDRSVDLMANGKVYTLQMAETAPGHGGGRRPSGRR